MPVCVRRRGLDAFLGSRSERGLERVLVYQSVDQLERVFARDAQFLPDRVLLVNKIKNYNLDQSMSSGGEAD